MIGRFIAHPNFFYQFDSDGDKVSGAEGVDATYALTKWELLIPKLSALMRHPVKSPR